MLDPKNLPYEALLQYAEELGIDTNENTEPVDLYFLILEAEDEMIGSEYEE